MDRDDAFFKMRMPANLLERLKVSAAQNRRNMSQEIVARLEATYGNDVVDGEWRYAHMRMDDEPSRPVPAERPAPATSRLEEMISQLTRQMLEFEGRVERRLAQQDQDIGMMVANAELERQKRERKAAPKKPSRPRPTKNKD